MKVSEYTIHTCSDVIRHVQTCSDVFRQSYDAIRGNINISYESRSEPMNML